MLSKDSSGYDEGGNVGIYIEDGRIVARFKCLATTYAVGTDVLITVGQSHHLVVTFGSDGLVVYVDGVTQASDAYTGGLLGNDSDANGHPLSATLVSCSTNGTLFFGLDGGLSCTPDPDITSEDSFTYRIEDGRGGSDTTTATITVNGINDAPEAGDTVFGVSPAALSGCVLGTAPATDAN